MITRRSLITNLAALVAAPTVIRTPGLLMPVKVIRVPTALPEVGGVWTWAEDIYGRVGRWITTPDELKFFEAAPAGLRAELMRQWNPPGLHA